MTTPISGESTVGRIAAEHPLSTRVFARHGIDFCCGGARSLAEACAAKGVDLSHVTAELERELASKAGRVKTFHDAPVPELIEHILTTFHVPLHEELPRLEALAAKVARAHEAREPRLLELEAVVVELASELEAHMAKEEHVLFPMLRQGRSAARPIAVMEHEHDTHGARLARLRALTDGYEAPGGACTSWRALYHRLAALERDLHEHVHLENNVLFPRVK